MQPSKIKQAAHQLVDQLPETSTWDDVVYEMAVRREIEKGLLDSDADRVHSVDAIMKEYGITD